MAQDLFRKEVVEAQRGSGLGAVSLAQPLSGWLLVLAALTGIAVIAAYLILGSYTRHSSVIGHLVPVQGLSTVLAPAAGVVNELPVSEGGHVTAGQTIAIIAVPRLTIASGSASFDLDDSLQQRRQGLQSTAAGQQRLFAAQAAGLTAQLASARTELAQIEAQIATRQQQIDLSGESLQRLRQLQQKGYVSVIQIEQQQAAVLDQVGQMQELQRQAITMRRGIEQLRQALQELPGQQQAATAGVQRDLAALAQEKVQMKAQGAFVIAAPTAGVVAAQIVKAGQVVQEGQPLLSLLPGDGELEAELLVPTSAIGFISPGDRVLLRYQAFPYQKFGQQRGTVKSISRSALGPGEQGVLFAGAASAQPLYRVTVQLAAQSVLAYNRHEPLKPGMQLDADILGERRRLVEWLFEPLYSLNGRLDS